MADAERCREAGLDPKRVDSVARRISKVALEARQMGLKIFGGSGSGTLRLMGKGANGDVAELEGSFDGGDGGDEF